ncbi:MAG TPA: AAA family ATPase, partial [Polyangiaceae bacterium]|nr:AAA family ATPase [Polyangiaceae bacterium]
MSSGEVMIPALELEEELGHGAFSVVYRARRGDRRCAVKIGRTGGAMARWFRREAAALARVRDPGVPEVLDVGVVDGRPYLVMDLVSGPTLEEELDKGPMSLADTIALGRELCRIVGEVHRRGLVHRDIKPKNIIIGARGRPTLVDFGLVTHLEPVFDVDAAAGTRSYAAPEQLHAPLLVDRRADLYALGRVLTECVGGRADPMLAPVLDRLLEEDPARRYADADELDRDLARIERGDAALGAEAPEGANHDDERTPLVGRAAELDQVRGEWGRAMLGRGSVVFYEGAPGSGKTRLLDAIARNLDPGLLLRCEGRGPLPMAALRDMLEAYLHDGALDADARASALREAAVGPHAPLVASISSTVARALGSTEELRERDHETFVEAVAEVILRLARTSGSMLVLVDDLQWLDPVSREVLVRVALGARSAPLLFVAAARTDSLDLAPLARFVAALGDARFQPRRLAPFGLREVREIVSVYLGAASPDPLLVEHVATLADETPLGALECLGALLDGGALRPSWGTWIFDRDVADRIWLPGEITNLLERRLEQIPQATRRVLDAA